MAGINVPAIDMAALFEVAQRTRRAEAYFRLDIPVEFLPSVRRMAGEPHIFDDSVATLEIVQTSNALGVSIRKTGFAATPVRVSSPRGQFLLQEALEGLAKMQTAVNPMMKTFVQPSDPMKEREHLADDEMSSYDFGDDVTVEAHSQWNRDDPLDFTKVVYVRYDDDAPDADTHKVSMHVRFDAEGAVNDVYALEMEHGNDIGARGRPASAAAARRP